MYRGSAAAMSRAHEPGAPRCACAACARGAADASVRRLVAEGSRIDKLYLGKYIPLRERKLLDKLVRTRAVYDDIRNRLLSESEASIKEKPNLKPRKHQARSKDLNGKNSTALIQLVDMVDKGNVPTGPVDLDECCSCCDCGSKSHTRQEHEQMRRHSRRHGHQRIAETMSRTSARVKQKMGEAKRGAAGRGRSLSRRMSETSALMRNKIKNARKRKTMSGTSITMRNRLRDAKRGVQFKPKSIMSEPCTCTSKLSKDMKRRSQELMGRLRPRAQYGEQMMFEGLLSKKYSKSKSPAIESKNVRKKQGRGKSLRKSYQKLKKSKARLIESIGEGAKRVRESQTKMKEHIEAEVKQSLEKLKSAKHKIQEGIKTAVRNSTRDLEFPIRKDSIAKFKETIETKKQIRDYECQHECVPGECVPEECFKIIKIRRIRNEKNIGVKSSVSETGVQVRKKVLANTGTGQGTQKQNSKGVDANKHKERKQKLDAKKKSVATDRRISIEIGTKKRVADVKAKAANAKEPFGEKKSVKSMTSLPPVSSKQNVAPIEKQAQKKQQNSTLSLSTESRKNKIPKIRQTNVRNSATKIDYESHQGSQTKLKAKRRKDAQIGSHGIKRCFCTLKLKGKGYRPKPSKLLSVTSNSQSQTNKMEDNNVEERVQTKPIAAREMACTICTQEKCDPKECLRINRHRGVGTKKGTKSTSSITTKTISTSSKSSRATQNINKDVKNNPEHPSKPEQVFEQGERKQLVRISSTFSFNIEFYKGNKPTDVAMESVKEEKTREVVRRHTRSKGTYKKKHLRHKHSQISSLSGKSKYTLTKHSLKRCFCTLKLGQANKAKAKPLSKSTGSGTSQRAVQYNPDVNRDLVSVNRAIGTDKRKNYHLRPYECEPGVCIPGDCDPYMCLELIKKRQIKYSSKYSNTDVNRMHAKHAYTAYRRTKSTSTFTSRLMTNKVKNIQSSISPGERKRGDKQKALQDIRTSLSSPDRQVVRISSSFSFNIEFYKGKNYLPSPVFRDSPVQRPAQSTAVTSITKPNLKEHGFQNKIGKKHQNSSTIIVKKKNRGSFIAPIKRCFCTLKLQSKQRREKNKTANSSVGTITPIKNAAGPKNVLITRATKTKRYKRKLEPYECDPGVCVPGECDPYECLQRIEQRQLRDSSTVTDAARMRSATSLTQRRRFRSKAALAQSKSRGRRVSTLTRNNREKSDLYAQKEQKTKRQVVRVGSTFSCNVEFCKDKPQAITSRNHFVSETSTTIPAKMKHRGAKTKKSSSSHHDTQASISQAHKGAGIRPMFKRCFCTLKFQNDHKKKGNTNNRPPQVIAVSTVTVTQTKIKSHKNVFMNGLPEDTNYPRQPGITCNQDGAPERCDFTSSLSSVSKSSVVFRYKEMQSYFKKSSLKSLTSNKLSNSTLKTFYAKINDKYAYSENCIICCKKNEQRYPKKRKKIMKYDRLCLKNQKSGTLSEPHVKPRVFQLSRQNYYAMNIQMPEKKRFKLKPYECEPGICVPGECDPYECEKLIMKRFMKSRMSGTNIRSKSMSSSTAPSSMNSKKLQSNQANEKVKKVPAGGMVFKTLPSHNQKQAVRVGSSFSFNIEFSKDRSSPSRYIAPRSTPVSHKPTKAPRKKNKEHGTAGHEVNHRDRTSQSTTDTISRGSGMKPMMQRCFCTLKLQKKGKNQRTQRQLSFERGTATPPNTKEFINSRTMMNVGQNTAAQKPPKLLPYECEPFVCVPGECDPYECLERIKRRNKKLKDFGTDAMGYKSSTGSMTDRRHYRNQGKQVENKLKTKQTKSRGSSETKVEKHQGRPSRQAVRIGSSFSFNVEFFKENSQERIARAPREPPSRPAKTRVRSGGVQKDNIRKKLRNRGLQDSKLVSHRDSQMGNRTHGKSTMTYALLKRCFCTAKLHGRGKPAKGISSLHSIASQSTNKKPFLERCFCVMKKLKGSKKPKMPKTYAQTGTETMKEPKLLTMDKKVVTRPYRPVRHELEPYECEPGVCVPGECDPYECEKLIKARNLKLQTREAYTDRPRTRSTSSNYSSQTSKARRTQSKFKTTSSTTKAMSTKPARKVQPARHASSNRQVVRIGSTFSFNVEFYKDRSPNTEEVQAAAKAIRYVAPPVQKPKKKDMMTERRGLNTADRGSTGSTATYNRESQANKAKMQDRGAGVAPVLKRCFCTLKLQKNKKQALKMSSQGTKTMKEIPTLQTRGVATGKNWKLKPYECEPGICVPYQCDPYECEKLINKRLLKETAVMTTGREKKYKLLPYECEPGVCVPGQCDPYECDKRIQARNMKLRDSGTSTKRGRIKSVSSNIRSTTSSKARKVQQRGRERRKRSQSVSSKPPRQKKSLDTSTRQSVRIGSGFSFDVEFYKNRSNASAVELKHIPVRKKPHLRKSTSSSANQYLAYTRNKNLQYHRAVRDTDSQILARKMRDAGVSPFLRRCFCTLKLQKSLPHQNQQQQPQQRKAGNVVDIYMATLLPYECEPGVCIPGECDPYECQKRIQRRLMRSQLAGTERGSRDSSTSSTCGKYKSSTCQSPKCPGSRKHQKATCARAPQVCAAPRPSYSSSSSSRQAVRLGSSFKFDVEFYKDRSPKPCEPVCREPCRPPKIRTHTITTRPKHKKTRSRSATSSELRFHHNQMQTGSRTESKSTGFGPRLKRCFCTLALHKKRQEQPTTRTKSTFRNDDLSDLYAFSRNVGVGTRKLKPYECEPGVCVPGYCDPYECYERIKRRMRDSGTATVSPSRKYASSITSRDAKNKCANTQCYKARARRDRPTMANFKEYAPKPCKKVCGDNARQAVRIGSNFSFSVEFYKDRPATKIPKAVYKIQAPEPRPKLRRVNRDSSTQRNYKSRLSSAGQSGYDQKCQVDCVKNTTRGTTMGAFLKRCFCTLNLHKNNKPPAVKPRQIQETRNEKPPDLNRVAMVQTRDKYVHKNMPYSLKPYECEPNVCIPGECNPYECLERIRRRNLRRHSRRIGTHRRSEVSVGSMASRLVPRTSRRLQSSDRRPCHASRPCQASTVVEEPRFAHVLEEMKTGVKIGSNVSFNVEFYKDKSQCPSNDVPKTCGDDVCSKPKEIKVRPRIVERRSTFSESRPRGMHIGVGDKCNKRTCEAQASGAVMKDRGAGVNNMLRRCFCTLKLYKNPPKVVTVNRLCIEDNNGMAFKQKILSGKKEQKLRMEHQFHNKNKLSENIKIRRKTKLSYLKDCSCEPKTKRLTEFRKNGNEMTTLYPYMPNKFNKNISKTYLRPNIENDISTNTKKFVTFNMKSKRHVKGKSLSHKRGLKKENEIKLEGKPYLHNTSHFQNMKSFLKGIFHFRLSKNPGVSSANCETTNKNTLQYKKEKNIKKNELKQDPLKSSKSDRRATNAGTIPKKTASLKLIEELQKKKARTDNAICCKKYSRYQCGDTDQAQLNYVRDRAFAPQVLCCGYCQVLDHKNKSPFESTKIVQMALAKNRNRMNAKIGTNTKFVNRGMGVSTHDPGIGKKICCPCNSKGRKSSGDHYPVYTEFNNIKVNERRQKQIVSGKGLKKDKEKLTKKDAPRGKKNIPSGDATNTRPKDYSQGKEKTQGSGSCIRCLSSVLDVIKFSVRRNKKKPCVCGSPICHREKRMMKGSKPHGRTVGRSPGGVVGPPPCTCGSKPCAIESRRERRRKREVEEFHNNIRCRCEEELIKREETSKQKEEDMKKKKLAEKKLLKEYKKEDLRRKKERIKQDKLKEKEIKKFQNSGDAALLAESVLDVLKLGFTAARDSLRCLKRTVSNPKRTARSMRELSRKPSRAFSAMGDACANSGVGSTVHRVRARCKAMRRVKALKQKLEGNSVTRYLMYMFSKDAKKRIGRAAAANRRRKREPIDFECSLFMASLRRRPCLAVYYNCPAFYPHCLSMLNLWKQFTDIMLVLVAVAVWSPCVVMMEVCRAAVCCFFCTG